nr:phage minor head protein [Sphaerisporangium cinnabarinum]
MTINDSTLRLARQMRAQIDGHVDSVTRSLTAAWVAAWDDLADQWVTAVDDLVAIAAANDGAWPSPWRIARAERVMHTLDGTRAALAELAELTGQQVTADLPALVGEAAKWEARLIASQMPASMGTTAELTLAFDRARDDALRWIVDRTTQQVTVLAWPLTDEATASMSQHLIRGVALGNNPRAAARSMVRNLESGFNGGLARALTIARTEMLDASRAASFTQDQANTDVLAGWRWQATLSVRTCPSCLAMHGTVHPIEEPGPWDHQNGRCARVPVTKSWRDLGFDLDDPEDALPDARAWFGDLPQKDQVKIMGPERLDLLASGRVSWDDLTTRRETPAWRPSQVVTPVRDLRDQVRTPAVTV